MNSFRPLVYLSGGANATRVFCRDSGLVQVGISLAIRRANQPPAAPEDQGFPGTPCATSAATASASATYRTATG
jgi:hypothetical protein